MAIVQTGTTTTYTTNYSTNLKASVDENIGLYSPQDTPFLASIGTGKARQRYEEWLEDDLDDVGDNAQLEGADPDQAEAQPSARTGNYCQIFNKTFRVSETLEVVDKLGRSSEVDRVSGLKTKSIGRDMEYAYLNGIAGAGAAGTPRTLGGALSFVDQSTDAYYNFGGTPAAANQLTEDIFIEVMQGVWEQGGKLTTCLAAPNQKKRISTFNQDNRISVNDNADKKRVIALVDLYQCDFGTVEVLPERFFKPIDDSGTLYDSVLFYDKRAMQRMTLRPIKRQELAKTGDARKFMIIGESTLKCRSRKTVGAIVNLSRTTAP